MPVALTIGGETVTVAPLNFRRLKAAWPAISAALKSDDMLFGDKTAIQAVAAIVQADRPELTAEAIEERLSVKEAVDLLAGFLAILREAGLLPAASEAPRPGEGIAAGP